MHLYSKAQLIFSNQHLAVSEVVNEETKVHYIMRTLQGKGLTEEQLDMWFANYDNYQLMITNYKHLPRVYSVDHNQDNQAYVLLDFEDGQTLGNRGFIQKQELEQLLDAVDHLHRKNIIHGAIEAANIWISKQGRVLLYGAGESQVFGFPEFSKDTDIMQLVQVFSQYGRDLDDLTKLLSHGRVTTLGQLRDIMFSKLVVDTVKGSLVEKNVKGNLVEKTFEESHNHNNYRRQSPTFEEVPRVEMPVSTYDHPNQFHTDYEDAINWDTIKFGGFWRRLIALLIDILILYVPIALIGGSVGTGIIILFSWLYYSLMESSKLQATLGKKLLGLKVVDQRGKKISFGRAVGRYFAKIVSIIILYIGFLMAAFTKRKQGLHDKIASTLIIVSRK